MRGRYRRGGRHQQGPKQDTRVPRESRVFIDSWMLYVLPSYLRVVVPRERENVCTCL